MTKQVEGVYERVLACAKEEFLEKGFSKSSLRTIAAKADTTTGTIYSRFGGKEGLFSAIVEPVSDRIIKMFLETQESFHALDAKEQPSMMETYVSEGMKTILDYVYDNFEEFELLLDASYGTKFQNFVEHLVEIETEYTYRFMDATGIQMKEGERITKNFMHIMNKALFESFFEVVRHNMSKEEARRYICMLEKYHSAGWDVIYSNCC